MSKTAPTFAHLAAQDIAPATGDGVAPEWIHLLPAGPQIETGDGRGPYSVADLQAIIDASFLDDDRLPVDENHSTDIAAPNGGASPARGWITAMEARKDGIWGKVDWTEAGRDLVASKAYRGISPVIALAKQKRKTVVLAILRASLVNNPNLRGLTALHSQQQQQETDMNFMQRMAKLLGLAEDATEDDIADAVSKLGKGEPASTELQSQLTALGVSLGLPNDADPSKVTTAAQSAVTQHTATVTALQSQVDGLTASLAEVQDAGAKQKAVAFVDGAIANGHVGVKPSRDTFIEMHSNDPDGTEAIINGLPVVAKTTTSGSPPAAKTVTSLNAEQQQVATALGIPEADYAATLAAQANTGAAT